MKSRLNMILASLLLTALFATAPLQAAEYRIDPAHSTVRFQIKHMTISKVNGTFSDVSGTFSFTADQPETWQATASIGIKSVDTGNAKRDDDLRSPDFFAAEKFPTMTFASTGVEMTSASAGLLRGELTMHGVTRPVVLNLEYNGTVNDPWGNERAGFSATGQINRRDWGLSYNAALESGGLLVGEDVKISLEIEGTRIP